MSTQPIQSDLPSDWQEKHVKKVYDAVCRVFDFTRSHVWPCVTELFAELPAQSRIIELGCGNGRHLTEALKLNREHQVFGTDLSPAMVKLCQEEKGLNQVIEGDICQFEEKWSGSFNCVLSMAVLHHLASWESRKEAVKNCLRYASAGGVIMFSVWALEQGEKSRRTFADNPSRDYFVPFKNKQGKVLGQRYYHLFEGKELRKLVAEAISEFDNHEKYQITKYWWEESNWIIKITKGL